MSVDAISWEQITPSDVLQLHAREMQRVGAQGVSQNAACVDSSVHSAYNAVLYLDDIDGGQGADLMAAAAYVLFYVSKNHCFGDGNKRAGWAALVHLLFINGLRVVATQDDAAAMVELIAASQGTSAEVVSTIVTWLAPRIDAIEIDGGSMGVSIGER